jgi:tRNA A37 methylthiotransferase MiaB
MSDQVSMHVRRERTARLRALSDDAQRRHLELHRGREQRVVPEGYDAVSGRWRGWSDTYVRVEYAEARDRPHSAVRVRITDIDHERQRAIGSVVSVADTAPYLPLHSITM